MVSVHMCCLIIYLFIDLSECLEKPYVFLVCLPVKSVFYRMWLLPFNKVELAGEMREALNKKYIWIPRCVSVTLSLMPKNFTRSRRLRSLAEL